MNSAGEIREDWGRVAESLAAVTALGPKLATAGEKSVARHSFCWVYAGYTETSGN